MRKKFTMLLTALFCVFSSSAVAQTYYKPGARTTTLEAGKKYFISVATWYNNSACTNLLYNNEGTLAKSNQLPNIMTDDATYLFTVEETGDNKLYYITNNQGKYLQADNLASADEKTGVYVIQYFDGKAVCCGDDVDACDENGNKIAYNAITAETPIVTVQKNENYTDANNKNGWRYINNLSAGVNWCTAFAFYEAVEAFPAIEVTTDPNSPILYTIKNFRQNKYASYNGEGRNILEETSVNYIADLFYFTEGSVSGTYKIHNLATSKLCSNANLWDDEGIDWYITIKKNSTNGGFVISKEEVLTDDWQSTQAWNDYNGAYVTMYAGIDAGSTWVIDKFTEERPTIKMSTAETKHFYFIKNDRTDNFATYVAANTQFVQAKPANYGSYWYFVDATSELPAGTEVPEGCIACRIYNAANELAVENPASGNMAVNSGVTYPAKIYYLRLHENSYWGYAIYPYNEPNAGWNAENQDKICNYDYDNDGSIWSIYSANITEAQLKSEAATSKANLLSYIEGAEFADYYTYSDEAITEARNAVSTIDTNDLAEAVTAMISSTFSDTENTLKSSLKGSIGPVAGDYIILKNRSYNKYLKANGSDITHSEQKDLSTIWVVEAGDEGNVKLKNYSTNKYIGEIRQSAKVAMVEEASAKQFSWTNQTDIYAVFKETSGGDYAHGHINGSGELVGWEPSANATQWIVSKAYPLTIKYLLKGQELTDYQVDCCVGKGDTYTISSPISTYSNYNIVIDECTATGSQPTETNGIWSVKVNEGTVVTVTLDDDLPFEYATTYENFEEDLHWYYLNLSADGNYLSYTENAAYIDLGNDKKTVDANNKDAYSWAFVGSPLTGFKIVNKAAGGNMILSSTTTTTDGNTGGSTYPIMTSLTDFPTETHNTYWEPTKSTDRAHRNGFYLEQVGHENNKMNKRSGKLAFWNGGKDGGSVFVVVDQYNMTQSYLGEASWEQSPIYPEGLKAGAASGSHGRPADHIGTDGHTIYKFTQAVVTTEADVKVKFNYEGGKAHGLITLGVDAVNGEGKVVSSDYHVGFTGGAQDNREYTLRGLPAGNYILRYYVCNKSGDHELNSTGGKIYVDYAKELTDIDAISTMWTTLQGRVEPDFVAYEGEGLGFYNDKEKINNIKEKAEITPEETIVGYTSAFVALDDVMDDTHLALPEEGKFYCIMNNNGNGYLSAGDGVGTEITTFVAVGEAVTKNIIFYYDGARLLSYEHGLYLGLGGNNNGFVHYTEDLNSVGTNFTFKKSPIPGKLLIEFKDNSRSFYSAGVGKSNAATAGSDGDSYRFTVTEVDMTYVISELTEVATAATTLAENDFISEDKKTALTTAATAATTAANNLKDGVFVKDMTAEIAQWNALIELANYLTTFKELAYTARAYASWMEYDGSYTHLVYDYATLCAEIDRISNSVNESTSTIPQIQTAIEDIEAIIAGFDIKDITPGFYYFVNYDNEVSGEYLSDDISNNGTQRILTPDTEVSAKNIFYYDGQNLIAYASGFGFESGICNTGTPEKMNHFEFGMAYEPGMYTVISSAGTSEEGSADGYWKNNNGELESVEAADASGWEIQAVASLPVTVGAAGWGTFYTPVPVTIPSTVVAYTIDGVSGVRANLVEVTGVVPANTGLILEGVGTHDFAIATATDVPQNFVKGDLQGSVAKTYVAKEDGTIHYVLAKPAAEEGEAENPVGLYRAAYDKNESNAFLNGACKVYLPVEVVSGEQNAPAMFSFGRGGEGTTSVEMTTDNSQQSTVIYDLTGRRIEKVVEKGIYIVNGQKVVIK